MSPKLPLGIKAGCEIQIVARGRTGHVFLMAGFHYCHSFRGLCLRFVLSDYSVSPDEAAGSGERYGLDAFPGYLLDDQLQPLDLSFVSSFLG
ncbi:hypothetical protein Trco_008131 [Trichoderma cornu-damae]|uniref:Uncharacterized protein n=1 Tax=Trichoderma cornu-damae TaxID=654480 RepID=A0A9P8QDV5_9HYPO|nr:hypothetical protein Trco_008131 [Trichoderma cornu-damae]